MRGAIALIWLLLLLTACQDKSAESGQAVSDAAPVSSQSTNNETQEMVDLLASLTDSNNFQEQWHQNRRKAEYLEKLISQSNNIAQKIQLQFQAGVEWLNAGEFDKSIALFKSVIDLHESKKVSLNAQSLNGFKELLAVSYLRKGEIENCVHHHNQQSCILPLDKSAVHKKRKGSEAALKIYEELLIQDPANLQNKWLYNLAQMTLGNYPDKVKPQFKLAESIFDSDYQLMPFEDVAMSAKVATNDISGGCIVDDFNKDGLLDIMASSYGLEDQIHYYENLGNGQFKDKTASAGLNGIVSGLNLCQADYNNDGHLDFIVLRGAWFGKAGEHPNSLIKNNGDGTFSDVTKSSGIFSLKPTQTAAWGDVNNDGWLDLFVGNETGNSGSYQSELFINQKNGTFVESAEQYGIRLNAFVKGSSWGDINNDGYLDLYISNLSGNNLLYQNLGPENEYRFKEIAQSAGVQKPSMSFPCWFWDYNNDGYDDIYVNSFDVRDFTVASGKVAADYLNRDVQTEYSCLYQNNGDNTFSNVTQKTKVDKVLYTMGCNFADIDNDGYQDFYASTGTPDFRAVFPNRMFRNNQGQYFQDVTTSTRTGHIQKGHGVGFGDLDNDGDEDMYVVLGGSYAGDNFMNALFKNPGQGNNWISLTLTGDDCNKSAIGSRIKIEGILPNGKPMVIHRTVNSGASFGASSLRQEIGLGQLEKINIEVKWHGGSEVTVLKNVAVNKHYGLLEGDTVLSEARFRGFEF